MRKILLALAVLLAPLSAYGQAVQQSGSITPNQIPYWVTNGVIATGGTASDSPISSIGVTNNGGNGICVSTGRSTAAGRQQLCLSASLAGVGTISLQNYGTASPQNLQFLINGTSIVIPTGGGTIPSITIPQVNGNIICASGTTGALTGCTTGTNGQLFVGTTSAIPTWVSASGDVASISSAGVFVIGKVNGVTYPASPSIGTAPYVSSSNTITYGSVPVTGGGTGTATLAAHGTLIGAGTSAITSLTTAQIGYCLLSQGASSDPIWASCASGTGTAGGSNTQVQFNNSSNLAGSANFTWVSPALTIGQNATTTGQVVLANGGALGVSVTIQNPSATLAYNFNLPTSAGSSGQPLISGGGSSTAMSFGTLGIGGGGTNCSAASGTCLDNITNFSSTGYLNRTGVGTYAFSALIPLSGGGTNANLTASNGGIFYSTATAGAILSGTATARQMLQSGASTTPAWSTTTWPATTTANQILYSSSASVIGEITTAASSVMITSAGSVPSFSQTLPSAVQANITTTGTIATGVWNGTVIGLAYGGTNANLTASNGGIFYSTATAGAILSGTATANQPLLSGSSTTPSWSSISYPTSATSGGIPYFSSTTAIASSAALTANQIMIGGGAGAAPSTFACATSTTVVHGGTPPTCSQIVAADITTNTVTNANLAQVAAVTLKGNPTNATANASDFTINGLTARGAPDAANDRMLIWDAASGTFKYVTPAQVASSATSGVSSIAGNTGAFTLANGIDNSTNQIQLTAARRTLPTIQTFTSGTNATYTTPASALWVEIYMVGGGGGGGAAGSGGGTGTTGGDSCWKASGTACTSPLLSAPGGAGSGQQSAGAPGTASACNVTNDRGGYGVVGTIVVTGSNGQGGNGGLSHFGGNGAGSTTTNGGVAATNSGSGGGGGAATAAVSFAGSGGSAAGYCAHLLTSPAGTYVYTVGAAGVGSTSPGTGGANGGDGAAGKIIVIEHYGT